MTYSVNLQDTIILENVCVEANSEEEAIEMVKHLVDTNIRCISAEYIGHNFFDEIAYGGEE